MPTKTFTLNTGAQIPAVGFGTWKAAPGDAGKAVEEALKAGYRHIVSGNGILSGGVPADTSLTGLRTFMYVVLPSALEKTPRKIDSADTNLGIY